MDVIAIGIAKSATVDSVLTSRLSGKVWNAIGDSLTEVNARATYHYHDYIKSWSTCTVNNYGASGTGWFVGDASAIHHRISSLPAADIITVFAGTNDWALGGAGMALGTLGDTDPAASFYGAVDNVITQLITKYPTKHIAVFTPTPRSQNWTANAGALKLQDIVDAIIAVCNYYSVPVLDLWRNSRLFPWDTTANATYFSSSLSPDGDGIHLNDSAHLLIAYQIYDFLNNLVGTSFNATPLDSTPPNNVTNLAATPGSTTVDLSWTASNSIDVAGYEIYNGATLVTTVTGTTYQVTGLTGSTAYTFTVKTKDNSGNVSSGVSVDTTTTTVPVTVVSDAFTRANSSTSLGNADTGQAWATLTDSVWGITSNQAYRVTHGTNTRDVACIDSGESDCTVSAKVTGTVLSRCQVCFRIVDANNLFYVAGASSWYLYKIEGGSSTTLGTYAQAAVQNDVVKVVLNGSSIKVYVNDVEIISVTSIFNQTATKHGLGTIDGSGQQFDDFSVVA